MKRTKTWGLISSGAQLYMLSRAERHRKELEREERKNNIGYESSKYEHRRCQTLRK